MKFQNELKTGSAKQRYFVHLHRDSALTNLNQCYQSWSDDKESAWKDCLEKKVDLNGFDMKINTFNGWMFTASFLFIDPDTGVLRLYTITKYCDYVCDYI